MKRIASLLLTGALVLSLTACGKEEANDANPSSGADALHRAAAKQPRTMPAAKKQPFPTTGSGTRSSVLVMVITW